MPVKACESCGIAFRRKYSTHRFCSTKCSAKWVASQASERAIRARKDLHCEWCGIAFWRPRLTNRKVDACRFCSKRCSGARRRAQTAERRAVIREQREQLRRQRHEARVTCACGVRIRRRTGRWCDACYTQRIGNAIREGHILARRTGLDHLCPNCGQWFRGYDRATFCSSRCVSQMAKRQCYPHISHLPIDERNQLAELIALVRAANRRLHTRGQPHRVEAT
jgi:hypothetical protein